MRKRLNGERVAGSAHIKTGLLSDARAIAGYVLDRNGRRHVVVMIVNHPRAREADAAHRRAARVGLRRAYSPKLAPERVHPPLHRRRPWRSAGPSARAVSPGHLLVASMPIFEPRPATGLAKSR